MMKKSILPILFSLSFFLSFSRNPPPFFSCESGGFCKLIAVKKDMYVVTSHALYKEGKTGLKQVDAFASLCNSATYSQDKIWLATEKGIAFFDVKKGVLSAVLPEAVTGNITHIEADELNNIWFTKQWEGCFKIDNEQSIQQIVKVPVTYSLAYTSDSNIWVGTNVGLYKVPASGKEIVRYAEEGIADNDLPDNLVERLYGTGNSIWAVMPGHISHIAPGEEEAPDFESLGSRNNELYDIAQLPYGKQAFMFATRQGILYLPDVQNDERFRTGEIHQEIKETAFHLTDKTIQKPVAVKDLPVISVQLINGKVYFLTEKGFWFLPVASLSKQLKK